MFHCNSLSKCFSKQVILNDIELHINKGETVALFGASGSGKSTLLKCINFLEAPDSGNAWIEGQQYMEDGKNQFELAQIRQAIGLLFQDFRLFPNHSCLENITMPLRRVRGLTKDQAHLKAMEISNRLGIQEVLFRYPEEISGGQAQRVSLARLLVLEPRLLLLDEITSALDPSATITVMDAVSKIREAPGCEDIGILMVTHHVVFAERYCDRILFLVDGIIVENHPAMTFRGAVTNQHAKHFLEQSKLLS